MLRPKLSTDTFSRFGAHMHANTRLSITTWLALAMMLPLLACSEYDIQSQDASFVGGHCELADELGPGEVAIDETCESEPNVGSWSPVIKWKNSLTGDILTTPVVGNLNDDNGDGLVNEDDIPDVVVTNQIGTTYALSGNNGKILWFAGSSGIQSSTPAIGDLDGDGRPEVVAAGSNGITAFRGASGIVKWHSFAEPNGATMECGAVGIYDLEGDGEVEVVIGNLILHGKGGGVKGKGEYGAGSGHAWAAAMGVAADIDRDGVLEVVTGNASYGPNGEAEWTQPYADAFVAVGNFDEDPTAEIAVSGEGSVGLLEHDGEVIWHHQNIMGSTSGPPTIGDFDNDGEPEIGVAGSGKYMVFETDGAVKWSREVSDWSSGFTGSSVFDFEGDGAAEVVYADENDLWVFNGADGSVKLRETRHSNVTCSEYPTVADVDKDGHAEIIYASAMYSGLETGIRVIGDANNSWAPARPVWNQHAYAVTNVNPDATIPANPQVNWDSYNTFRSGDITAGQGGGMADLVAIIDDVCTECAEGSVVVQARIANQGSADVRDPFIVSLFAVDANGVTERLQSQHMEPPLEAGSALPTLVFDAKVTVSGPYDIHLTVDDGSLVPECKDKNNTAKWSEAVCTRE
jgi:hypothetical protein